MIPVKIERYEALHALNTKIIIMEKLYSYVVEVIILVKHNQNLILAFHVKRVIIVSNKNNIIINNMAQ